MNTGCSATGYIWGQIRAYWRLAAARVSALFMARTTGAQVIGVDVNAHGIAAGNAMAHEQRLDGQAHFQQVDASGALPFADAQFDALVCIDAINHLPGRLSVLREWRRVVKSDGLILFTDPITVTGLLSNEEIAIRSSIRHFLFISPWRGCPPDPRGGATAGA